MTKNAHLSSIGQQIWQQKYQLKADDGTPIDKTIGMTHRRVARAIASLEDKSVRKKWERRFFDVMSDFSFMPAGRILAGAGSGRDVTLFNCFVMGRIEDDLSSIFEHVKEAALTMQQGGGIGHDFSTLRPRGAPVRGVGADASGPVSFMDVWDAMCRTIMSAGSRRGAMMGTLRCDHPDIEEFIEAKSDPDRLRMFNLSVLVTDKFIEAVEEDLNWDLVFDGRIAKTLRARDLWDKIMRATYDYAEPGVIFIDRINRSNRLGYCEEIFATNPCGEQPLPPYGACLLGSINLARLVERPFGGDAGIDAKRLKSIVRTAVRFLDNAIDLSDYPLGPQALEAKAKRRIGLGVTGLADALAMMRLRYGSEEAAKVAKGWMRQIEYAAYSASARLAKQKGAFPLFDEGAYLASGSAQKLDARLRKKIEKSGLRNGLLTSIAPTGTISLLADNVSSGVEPVFDFRYSRNILRDDGQSDQINVEDYAYRMFIEKYGQGEKLPDYFVSTEDLGPDDHLRMQAALQAHVDSSISKTINCPENISFEAFKDIYLKAYRLGLKGCTTYRPNRVTGAVLEKMDEAESVALDEVGNAKVEKVMTPHTESDVIYMSQPLEREQKLSGATYKLNWPQSDHAYYVTINDIEIDGRRRPFEIFINSKNLDHYAWTVALTRMISAVFRRGGDVSFVVEELKDVFDPRGGFWMEGQYVPSLLASIGDIVGRHLIAIGFMTDAELLENDDDGRAAKSQKYCPKCHSPSFIHQEGCWTCRNCGYSKCN